MRTAVMLWRSAHPGPTLVVTAVALGLGIAVGLDPAPLALLVVAVLSGQISIGLSNDAIDAPRDRAAGRGDKPLARPGAPLRTARVLAAAAAVLALLLSAVLGWQLAAVHLVFLGAGWAYNAGLKSTVWSALCFAAGFGAFPSLAPLALPEPQLAPAWAGLAGALFGLAIHFSNVLPDLEDDERTGVRGLPHRIGRRGSAVVAFLALVAGALVVAAVPIRPIAQTASNGAAAPNGAAEAGAATDGVLEALPWIGFAAVTALAVCDLALSLRQRPTRLAFRLVMLAAAFLAVQLILTGGLAR